MKSMTGGLCAVILGAALALSAGGCGKLSAGGEGSETHWLQTCGSDEDCGVGQCLCGVCTLSCASLRDCPAPLDQCSDSGGSCEQKVCTSSEADSSSQALSVAEPYPVRRYPSCDDGRQVAMNSIDVGFRAEEALAATIVVPDSPSGFLFFGGPTKKFFRVGGTGDLVRELPPLVLGRPDLQFDDAVALADGSLLLSGRDGDQAWVGKIDTAWNLSWQRELETLPAVGTRLAALPDGGAVALVFSGTLEFFGDAAPEWEATSVDWGRISSSGEQLWHVQGSIAALRGQGPLPRSLIVTHDTIELALRGEDGIRLITADLDGNSDSQLVAPPGAELRAMRALPGGRLAILRQDQLLLLDESRQVEWEHSLGDGLIVGSDLAFDEARNELLVVGTNLNGDDPGSFIGGVNVAGAAVWEMRRQGWPPVHTDLSEAIRYGSSLDRVAVDAAGNAVATGAVSSLWLSMTWVGAEACGG